VTCLHVLRPLPLLHLALIPCIPSGWLRASLLRARATQPTLQAPGLGRSWGWCWGRTWRTSSSASPPHLGPGCGGRGGWARSTLPTALAPSASPPLLGPACGGQRGWNRVRLGQPGTSTTYTAQPQGGAKTHTSGRMSPQGLSSH